MYLVYIFLYFWVMEHSTFGICISVIFFLWFFELPVIAINH